MEDLARRLRAVEERWRPWGCGAGIEGWATALGDLARGRVHEWLGGDDEGVLPGGGLLMGLVVGGGPRDSPPPPGEGTHPVASPGRGLLVWVGRRVWPYAGVVARAWWKDCVLVDPPDEASRLWALEVCLRSEATAAVVGDGTGLSLTATRRLQLAAESGRALTLLARPGREISQRSAAAYRWRVDPQPSPAGYPRWRVELLRHKDGWTGAQAGTLRITMVEWRDEQGLVAVPALVADRAAV